MIFYLDEELSEAENKEKLDNDISKIYLVSFAELRDMLDNLGIYYEGDLDKQRIEFSRIEAQQDFIAGSIAVPKLVDVIGKRYRILFFVRKKDILIADDDDITARMIRNIRKERTMPLRSVAQFIYCFLAQLMKQDSILLENYEDTLLGMEDEIMTEKVRDFQGRLLPLRKELLTMRNYYDQIAAMGEELKQNENGFFAGGQLKYFDIVSNRANRYKEKANYLLEYANQVREAYQARVDARQNSNMQFLTILTSIFFPLTLITGWYGMNFHDMPELENGYPYIIAVSILVVLICIFIFKKKKLF